MGYAFPWCSAVLGRATHRTKPNACACLRRLGLGLADARSHEKADDAGGKTNAHGASQVGGVAEGMRRLGTDALGLLEMRLRALRA